MFTYTIQGGPKLVKLLACKTAIGILGCPIMIENLSASLSF